ncbi:MAG: MATE family efflux transporter [Bacteroidaceae bacterium]|nr:MATE family efflux transporter [Bacteroidaceae bacterium]
MVRNGAQTMSLRQKLRLIVLLSVPSMIAQLSSVVMQMIDAAMLGHLSTNEAASVGLVSTTIWLFGGFCSAAASGFSVQVAHHVGANDQAGARKVIRQGMVSVGCFAFFLTLIGILVAPFLPIWLNTKEEAIRAGATEYLTIVCCALPVLAMDMLAAGSLRCSGNIKTPSMLNTMMCFLDVVFNYIFIFQCHMGIMGAAYGTFLAYVITTICMLYALVVKDKMLRFSHDKKLQFKPTKITLLKAFKIGSPIGLERGVMCGAQIAITGIIAPLGNVAIAANMFGIEVEGLCYMPGYGVAEAATTLVGQSKGAKREDLMRSFAWIAMALGISIMAVMGIIMWVFAPEMMAIITPKTDVITLGTEVLRIEAWAEPGFAAAIVAYSVFVGAGKTLVPSIMNVASIWIVRLSLATLLAPVMGLRGVWIAMAIELCWRGFAFIIKLTRKGWSKVEE